MFRSQIATSGSAIIYNSQNSNWAQRTNLVPVVGNYLTSSYIQMSASLTRTIPSTGKKNALINIAKN